MDYKYKFSIISAVYNVENFVAHTIESLIRQTIGFSNIQLILVDDGSPDSSGDICDSYAKQYPNITVIHKENGGVSSARNAGLAIAEGKYINFLDSDDMLSEDSLSEIERFFDEHYEEIDMVAIPLMYFDAKRGPHVLNYKFEDGSRVIDLEEEWNLIQMHVASGFFKASAIKNLYFDTELSYAEDAKFVQLALLNKRKLGLLDTATYMYRSRRNASSAIQTSGRKPNWYIPVLNGFHKGIINHCIDNYGYIPKFVQMNIMYDLQWRIKRRALVNEQAELTEDEKEEYLSLIKEVLAYIDDDVILAQRNTYREHKMFVMRLKYSCLPNKRITKQNICFSFSPDAVFKISKTRLYVEFFKIHNNRLIIEGYTDLYNLSYGDLRVVVWVDGKSYTSLMFDRNYHQVCLDTEITNRYGFKKVIQLNLEKPEYDIKLGIEMDGKRMQLTNVIFRYFAPFSNHIENTYYLSGRWLTTLGEEKNHFVVRRAGEKRQRYAERKFQAALRNRELDSFNSFLEMRREYWIEKEKKTAPLWLISDRFGKAGDNGEAFFKYVVENHPEIDARFIISKESPDYKRIKKIGKIVEFGTREHKMAILLSDFIFSSQGENEYFDPFNRKNGERDALRNLIANKPFIFLQHGVIKNDLSGWLNRFNKNIFGFITSAQSESDSIINGDYYYDKNNIWLTGLPRFDSLRDASKKIITIMPTWRKNLTAGCNFKTSVWRLRNGIEDSDYVKFFNSVLTDKRLKKCCRKYGYKINFLLHPNLTAAARLFKRSSRVKIISSKISYNKIFARSKLVVTDYSSAVFDFAYLRKPIIYTQFDIDEFYGGSHTSNFGYFDDARDGFGEVEYDVDGTVNRIIEYIENGCELKPKYRERIDNFFAFNDKNNCKRIADKVLEISKK